MSLFRIGLLAWHDGNFLKTSFSMLVLLLNEKYTAHLIILSFNSKF